MDPDYVDIALAAVMIPVLTGLGEVWKGLGVKPPVVPVVNILVANVTVLGYVALSHWPRVTGQIWATGLLTALVCGLAASSLYDATKAIASKK